VAAKLLIAQRESTLPRRSVKPHQSTRWADGWISFPFQFTECDLGHDGGLRGSVGKRSLKYNTRSPFFLAAMGSTSKQGKPNGNQKREGTTLTLGKIRSKERRLNLLKAFGSEGCLPSSYRKGQPILLIIRKGVRLGTGSQLPNRLGREESRDFCRC